MIWVCRKAWLQSSISSQHDSLITLHAFTLRPPQLKGRPPEGEEELQTPHFPGSPQTQDFQGRAHPTIRDAGPQNPGLGDPRQASSSLNSLGQAGPPKEAATTPRKLLFILTRSRSTSQTLQKHKRFLVLGGTPALVPVLQPDAAGMASEPCAGSRPRRKRMARHTRVPPDQPNLQVRGYTRAAWERRTHS